MSKLIFVLLPFIFYHLFYFKNRLGIGDWGLEIGDWGLGIGPNPQSPTPRPQAPIPNPHKAFIANNYYKFIIN